MILYFIVLGMINFFVNNKINHIVKKSLRINLQRKMYMLGILIAIGLGLWLILSMGRKPKATIETCIFVSFIIFSVCLMNRFLLEIDKSLVMSWFFQWIYVFLVFWLFDVICLDIVSTVIYAVIVSIGYYLFQLYSLGWAQFFLG